MLSLTKLPKHCEFCSNSLSMGAILLDEQGKAQRALCVAHMAMLYASITEAVLQDPTKPN